MQHPAGPPQQRELPLCNCSTTAAVCSAILSQCLQMAGRLVVLTQAVTLHVVTLHVVENCP